MPTPRWWRHCWMPEPTRRRSTRMRGRRGTSPARTVSSTERKLTGGSAMRAPNDRHGRLTHETLLWLQTGRQGRARTPRVRHPPDPLRAIPPACGRGRRRPRDHWPPSVPLRPSGGGHRTWTTRSVRGRTSIPPPRPSVRPRGTAAGDVTCLPKIGTLFLPLIQPDPPCGGASHGGARAALPGPRMAGPVAVEVRTRRSRWSR